MNVIEPSVEIISTINADVILKSIEKAARTCYKTEINIKANVREWRHILKLRCAKQAHPSVRQIMLMVLKEFHQHIPVLFDDLYDEFLK